MDKQFIECLSLTFFFIFLSFFSLCFVFIEGNYDAQIGERRTNSLLKRGCQIPANMNNEIHLGCDDDHDNDAVLLLALSILMFSFDIGISLK